MYPRSKYVAWICSCVTGLQVSYCIQDHGRLPGLEASEQKRRHLEQCLREAVAAEDFENAAALKKSLQILLEAY